jgi:triacylglycerol lipase
MALRQLLALGLLSVAACAAEPTDGSEDVASNEDALAEIGDEPAGAASKHAIVLAHGFDASDTNRWSWSGVAEALAKDGHVVHSARVQPYQSIERRARELALHVDEAREECASRRGCDASKVHIIAHSMGGLDSRFVIAKLSNHEGTPYAKLVASLTTISTPHRGSAFADTVLKVLPSKADPTVNALAGLWAKTFTDADLAADSDVRAALHDISEEAAPDFNAAVPNAPGVVYQSWAGITSFGDLHIDDDEIAQCEGKVESYKNRADNVLDHGPISSGQLQAAKAIVGHGGQANDGMVTVESAKWGTFKGCIPADHMDEVGQRLGISDAALWSRFNAVRFYRRVAFGLDAAR